MLQLLTGSVVISFSSVFVKLSQVGPTAAGVYRTLFGGAVLCAAALACGGRLTLPSGRSWRLILGCGAVFAVDLACWHASIHRIGPGLSTILANFQVFFLGLIGAFVFRERVGLRFAASVAAAIAGISLMVGPSRHGVGPGWNVGLWLGLATAAAYAVYILLLRRIQRGLSFASAAMHLGLVSLVSAALLLALCLLLNESPAFPRNTDVGLMLAYGVLCQAGGWMLISTSLPRLPVSLTGLIILLQPTLSFVWDMLFFHRPTTATDIAGACIALAAIYVGTQSRARS